MSAYKKQKAFPTRGFLHSVNAALEGVVYTIKTERNMRFHFLLGFLVMIAGLYFNLGVIELMLLCFAVTFVLAAEMFNTAIEYAVDLISDQYFPLAKVIKDIAAGAVFVSAVNAIITGYLLFAKSANWGVNKVFSKISQSPWHITLITLLAVIGLVLLVKILRHEESLLKGGMPSGHAAVAFSAWVTVSLLTVNAVASILVLLLAVLVAKSRMANGVHNLWEVIAGGALGTLVTLLIFQVLS